MAAHHLAMPGAAPATPALDAGATAWLRMRQAPVRGARHPACGRGAVRDVLRAIASSQPDPAALARRLGEVRTLLDRRRDALRRRAVAGEPLDEIARARARLLDGTLVGLCHLGWLRELRPAGMVPPLAVIARGDYGRRQLAPWARADLLFLVPGDPVRLERGLGVARFVARELSALGWQASVAKRTLRGCLAETLLDPAIASDLCAARLVWGCPGLFAELRAGVAEAARRGPAGPTRRTLKRTAGAALAA
jgi:UTP:GlnB (protein PII) uridylyltransferase